MLVHILNKIISVSVRGCGDIPLLVIGPANLFLKPGMLPDELDDLFTLYFVDIFNCRRNQKNHPASKFALIWIRDRQWY